MKILKWTWIFVFFSLISLTGCSFFGSDQEETELRCTAYQLSVKKQGSMMITLSASRSTNKPDKANNLFDAVVLEFHGAVTMVDCHNASVNSSKIECSLNPALMTSGKNSYVFWITPPDYHTFVLTNSLEYFLIRYYMIAQFANGRRYKSDIISASTAQIKDWNGRWDQVINSTLSEYTNWQLLGR